jgi:membrane-associated phospholipid phosphatase
VKKTGFLPIDIISLFYVLFSLVYIAIGYKRVPDAAWHFGAFLAIGFFILLLTRIHHQKSGIVLSFFRYWYPFILLNYFFQASTIVNHVIFPSFIDGFFQDIDKMIFGYQPVREWGMRYSNVIIQEVFHFAYASYYLVVPGIAFLIFFRKREYFEKYVFTVAFVFYACYITYYFLPVVGGRYWQDLYELTMTFRGGPFTRIMAFIYTQSQHFGSAFPSSHVAITVVVNIATFNYSRKLAYWLAPLSFILSIATVYCHYHYFIDAVFGILYGVGSYYPAIKLYAYLSTKLKDMQAKIPANDDRKSGELVT